MPNTDGNLAALNQHLSEIDSDELINQTVVASQEYFEAELLKNGMVEYVGADGEHETLHLHVIIGDNSFEGLGKLQAGILMASVCTDQNSLFLKKMLEGRLNELLKGFVEEAALQAAHKQHGV